MALMIDCGTNRNSKRVNIFQEDVEMICEQEHAATAARSMAEDAYSGRGDSRFAYHDVGQGHC